MSWGSSGALLAARRFSIASPSRPVPMLFGFSPSLVKALSVLAVLAQKTSSSFRPLPRWKLGCC
jgi:hypothetical protein